MDEGNHRTCSSVLVLRGQRTVRLPSFSDLTTIGLGGVDQLYGW